MHIQLQTSVEGFDAGFVKELRSFETVMRANGLDPAAYIIAKDPVQFTSLPFFVRPGGDGYNYTVFIDGESFTVTKASDTAFLGYFEQLCAGALEDSHPGGTTSHSLQARLSGLAARVLKWFNTPLYDKPK